MASTELKIVLFVTFFMFLFNLFIGLVVSQSSISLSDKDAYLNNIQNSFIDEEGNFLEQLAGYITGNFITGIFIIASAYFSLFGVDFILLIDVLPTWFNSIFVLFNITGLFAVVFYIIDRIWIG